MGFLNIIFVIKPIFQRVVYNLCVEVCVYVYFVYTDDC